MSDVAYRCKNLVFAATAGAKTALVVAAPAGYGLKLSEWSISFDGVTSSAVPATVEFCTLTLAGAGTPAASPPAAIQCRGRAFAGNTPVVTHNYTVEPSVIAVLDPKFISPNGGVFIYPMSLGKEFEVDSSGGTLLAFAIRVNVSANVNVLCGMEVQPL